MCSDRSNTPSRVLGFPIRISTDQSLVGSSPWLFAATHVLHRCQVPRHPPLALYSLEEQRCSYSLCSSQGARRPARGRPPGVSDARMPARTSVPAAPCRVRGIVPSKQKRGQSPAAGATIRRFLTPTTDCAFRSGPSESPTRESPPRCVEAMTP